MGIKKGAGGGINRPPQERNYPMTETTMTSQKVTFRNNGKAHRGVVISGNLFACCRCPGSQNGWLTANATIICDGHEQANCGT